MHVSLQFSTTTYQFRPRCRIWLNLSACRWPVLAPPRISSNLWLEATFHAAAFFLGQNILKHNRKKMVFGVVAQDDRLGVHEGGCSDGVRFSRAFDSLDVGGLSQGRGFEVNSGAFGATLNLAALKAALSRRRGYKRCRTSLDSSFLLEET